MLKHTIVTNTQFITNVNNICICTEETDLSFFLKKLYQKSEIDYPKFFKMDDMSRAGFIAAEFLLKEGNLAERFGENRVAMVFANKTSTISTDLRFYETIKNPLSFYPNPGIFVYTLPNIVMGEISIRHHFKGEQFFFVSEKFDTHFFASTTRNLLENDKADAVIGGWVEVSATNKIEIFLFLATKEEIQDLTEENLEKIYQLILNGE